MKTKQKLILVIFFSIVMFFLLSIILDSLISKKINTILEKKLEQNKNEVNKIMQLENSGISSYVFENSYWDELYNATLKKDTAWMNNNMAIPLTSNRYNSSLLWIMDYDGKNVYTKSLKPNAINFKFNLPTNMSFLDTLKSKTGDTYSLKLNDQYISLTIASIVPGSDFARKTTPVGFLIVGKIIDNNYLKNLNSLNTFFEYSFAEKLEKEYVDIPTAKICFYKSIPCKNDISINIKITSHLPEVKAYSDFVHYILFIYLVSISVIMILIFYYFIHYFFRPLANVSKALAANTLAPIKNVKTKNTDLGEVARMIESYFKQNGILQKEINKRKKTEQELRYALENIEKSTFEKVKAEQSAAAKSEFLATMSHEIRTPINGVIGIANLLKDENLTKQQKEYVDVLHFSASHLMSLVSDILDFSKIESGVVGFEKNSFDLNSICTSLYNLHSVSTNEKEIQFIYAPDTNLKQSIYGDSIRLNQILTNLIGNAVKFTEKGGVTFTYNVIAETTNNCTIEFKIKDTGIGIALEEQSTIFNGFSQANRKISTEFGGTGLGLTICKKLIELQGGKIHVDSEIGKGSTFTFYINFEKHPYTAVSINSKVADKNKLCGMKVLIAEDNNINVLVLQKFLEKWGISNRVAKTGKEAVSFAENEFFDAILMDVHMPEMDGMEATNIIRNNTDKKINSLPIIALTANATADTQNKLLNNGFTNFVSKPFDPNNLFKLLKRHYCEE